MGFIPNPLSLASCLYGTCDIPSGANLFALIDLVGKLLFREKKSILVTGTVHFPTLCSFGRGCNSVIIAICFINRVMMLIKPYFIRNIKGFIP